jgi:hypothetical protein
MVIKRIGPLSVGKIAGTLYAVMGVLIGAVVSLIAMAGSTLGSDTAGASGMGALLGVGAIVIFPVLYGGLGFVFTMLAAVLYNVVAGMVGGVEVDLQ